MAGNILISKIPLTLCTKFETLVAPSKLFSKLLKFCMVYFITKINKMRDEEVKNLKFDFSWITLLNSLNFHPNFSSQAPKFGNFQLTSPQIWKFSAHKPPFSEANVSSQAPHFGNPGRTPLPEKKLSAPPPRIGSCMWYIEASTLCFEGKVKFNSNRNIHFGIHHGMNLMYEQEMLLIAPIETGTLCEMTVWCSHWKKIFFTNLIIIIIHPTR